MAIVATVAALSASAQVKAPDFAYPKTVKSEAEKGLKKAGDDGVAQLDYLMQLTIADALIDEATMPKSLERVLEYGHRQKNPQTAALFNLYAATLANQIYERNMWTYDRRDLPLAPRPKDMTEWSGKMFRFYVDSLCTAGLKAAGDMPVADLLPVISADKLQQLYFPTLRDFATAVALGLQNPYSSDISRQMKLYESAIAAHPEGSAPWYAWHALAPFPGKCAKECLRLFNEAKNRREALVLWQDIIDETDVGDSITARPDFREALKTATEIAATTEFKGLFTNFNNFIYGASVTASAEEMVPADTPFELALSTVRNASKVKVTFVRFDNEKARRRYMRDKLGKGLDTYEFTYDFENTPVNQSRKVSIVLPAGYYAVRASADNHVNKQQNLGRVDVLPYTAVLFKAPGTAVVGVYGLADGKAMSGAKVSLVNHKDKTVASGTTDRDGRVSFPVSVGNCHVRVSALGIVKDFDDESIYNTGRVSRLNSNLRVSFATQRGLYHPGDSVRFVAVAMNDSMVVADRRLTIKLTDVDGKEVAKTTGVTDTFGRFAAAIAIPAEVERTGSFRLIVDDDNISGSASVMVSDYKLQGIEMADLMAIPNDRASASATVSGRVRTFSGQPVSNAVVTVRLNADADSLKAVETLTDTEGKFSAVVKYPASFSKESRYMSATATVTGPDGNTVSESTSFDGMYPYTLTVVMPYDGCSTHEPLKLIYLLHNAATDSLAVPVKWQLMKDKKPVKEGTIESSPAQLDFRDMRTGYYCLSVTPADTLLAAPQLNYITLYNPGQAVIPDSTQNFYLPKNAFESKNCAIDVEVGVNRPVTLTAVIPGKDGAAPSFQSFALKPGYRTIAIKVGDGERAELVAVNNGSIQRETVSITHPQKPELTVTLESFRDKVVSGGKESWTVKVTDKEGHAVDAAVVANIYDYRLDLLRTPARLSLHRQFYTPNPLRIATPYSYRYSANFLNDYKLEDVYRLTLPTWRYSFVGSRRHIARPLRAAAGKSKQMSDFEDFFLPDEAFVAYGTTVAEAPMANKAMAVESVAEAADAEEEEAEPDAGEAKEGSDEQVEIRTGELTEALWAPMFTARNGIAAIDFAVPNANTTWAADVTVFTRDLASARVSKCFVSQKPVMVSINAPRFLRVGDRASVIASYMNTTDKPLTVRAMLVGSDSLSRSLVIEPGATQTMTVPVSVNAITDSIFVTATALAGEYSDGERHLIPVYSSQAAVTDARNFYINRGDTVFTMELPQPKGEDFRLNLTYTENPMWTVVEALPSLLGKNIAPTANAQAAAYFSAAVALGLMEQHPELEYKFNKKELQGIMRDAEKALEKLQTANGSFQWGPWSRGGDTWSTGAVLDFMATLKRAGYLPEKSAINSLIPAAVRYYDKEVKDVNMLYAIIRPAFPEVTQSLNGQSVTHKTLQYINKNWKNMSIGIKAEAASTLHFNGADNMARKIMESVDQFGTQTPSKGYEFKNVTSLQTYAWLLQAYGGIDPKSEHVDGIRQYLIVRKQATDWGNSAITSWIVNAMITSGTPWTTPAEGTVVRLQDGVMQFTPTERMGTISVPVSGPTMTLELSGKTPSYGAVTATYIQPMADVKAFSDGEISVEKELLLQDRATARYKHLDKNTALKIGDRVKVLITVKSDRPMSHVTITDDRAAALEPVDQLPGYVYADGVCAYRENRDAATNLYIDYLPKGTYLFEYELTVNNAGTYSTGIATATCTQAPTLTAHSSGSILNIP